MTLREEEFYFTWIMENYLFCNSGNVVFSHSDSKCRYWSIRLFPNGKTGESEGYVYFRCVWEGIDKIKPFDVNLKLCNGDDKIIIVLDNYRETVLDELGFVRSYDFLTMLKTEELVKKMKNSTNDTLIVRCRIRMENNSNVKQCIKVNKTIKSKINIYMFPFCWEVDFEKSLNCLTKKVDIDKYELRFEISVKAPEDNVLIEIHRFGTPNRPDHRGKCQISLLNNNAEMLSSCHFIPFGPNYFGDRSWHFPPFFKKSDLLHDETYSLRFEFFISDGSKFNETVEETKDSDNPAIDSLQDDLRAMLLNKKFADVRLLVDNEVCAHKLLLSSRSPVFSAMFDQDMVENQTGEINIPDMNADTMKMFLQFLYTGKLDESNWEMMLYLLMAAEKYQVPSLKEKCSEFLSSHLDANNICDIVSVADLVGHTILKTAAINYIKKHSAEILGSPKWLQWIKKNVELGSEILCKLSETYKTKLTK